MLHKCTIKQVSAWKVVLVVLAALGGPCSAYSPLGVLSSQPGSLAELRNRLSSSPDARNGASPLVMMVLGKGASGNTSSPRVSGTGSPSSDFFGDILTSTLSGEDGTGILESFSLGETSLPYTIPGTFTTQYFSTSTSKNSDSTSTPKSLVLEEKVSSDAGSSTPNTRYFSSSTTKSTGVTSIPGRSVLGGESFTDISQATSTSRYPSTSAPSKTNAIISLLSFVLGDETASGVKSGSPNSRYPIPTSTQANEIHYQLSTTHNSVLGSLFELGIGDIEEPSSFTKKIKGRIDMKKLAPLNSIIKELNNMTFLPLVPLEGGSKGTENDVEGTAPLLEYLDGIRGGAWAQFKSMALGYSNWLTHEYEVQHLTEKLPLDLIKKILDLGDRVNFLHVVGKRVDPGLAGYIADQLQPLFDHFEALTAGRMLGGSVADAIGGIIRDAAWKAIRQFVRHVLRVAGNVVTRDELETFKESLAKTSPLAARGLDLILNGPFSPRDAVGRSMRNRMGGFSDQNDGFSRDGATYGSIGSYDESFSSYGVPSYGSTAGTYPIMGYTSKIHLDPYLILGGLGAAVLLAFLAYRVLVTTKGGERSNDALTFMDLSDMPGVVHSIYSMLEGADDKYRARRSSHSSLDDSDDLAYGLNSLWREHQNDSGCVKCSLFSYTIEHTNTGHDLLQGIAVAGVAHLLGTERSGQLMDEVTSLILEGTPVTCEREVNTCVLK
ncbi:uncharacterized protein [Cherax quadricarinatus]